MVVVTINTLVKPPPWLVLLFLDRKSVLLLLAGYVNFLTCYLRCLYVLPIDWSTSWYCQSQGGLSGWLSLYFHVVHYCCKKLYASISMRMLSMPYIPSYIPTPASKGLSVPQSELCKCAIFQLPLEYQTSNNMKQYYYYDEYYYDE
jgi:hypothetical protein